MENDLRPQGWGSRGPKPKELVTGEIEGIKCGWEGVIIPPEQVYELAYLGLNNKEIGSFYNVSDATIARNFVAELQKGREMTKIKLRRAMMKNAIINENATMQIYLSKAMLGMSETQEASQAPLPWIDGDLEIEEDNEIRNHDNADTQDS